MIYLLSAILVGFGAWYAYHVYQKVVYRRKMRKALRSRQIATAMIADAFISGCN